MTAKPGRVSTRRRVRSADRHRDASSAASPRVVSWPHAYPHANSSLLQVSIESISLSITAVQFLFTTLTCLFHKKCNGVKARVVIYAYRHHVRLLSREPVVVMQPQSTRVEEPTLLCNHLAPVSDLLVIHRT